MAERGSVLQGGVQIGKALLFCMNKLDYEKAKEALEKASKGQELISSPWDAAKHMESAAALAKELGKWNEVADFYRRASELYVVCGRSQPASDALAKGARALEDSVPDEAIQLYTDACVLLEDDDKDQMAFDLYRAATSVYIKLEKYTDAAAFLLRWGLAADKCNATNSQCKKLSSLWPFYIFPSPDYSTVKSNFVTLFHFSVQAYLSAIIVYLYVHDIKQAEKCYNDCSQVDTFSRSDQCRFAKGDVEEIKRLSQSSTVIRLARKLPTGDVSALKTHASDEQEPLDEDDLT
ncbi:gamma-soluble NSF attachment protein [Prunus dulcis]|uniref:Gamma-soluble NSF attachment protein n=1 Tax=Prunus dulcis TaxID=3755 RepID=A0A4Y1RBI7_PRUDU|nr:gamma-soluble NSF attachment protein [Prunus dulcis]